MSEMEESDEEGPVILKQTNVTFDIGSHTYTAHLELNQSYDYEHGLSGIHASLFSGWKVKKRASAIGSLNGSLVRRPSSIFHEMTDSVSAELEWLGSVFCNPSGHVTNIATNLPGRDVYRGGFLHVDTVSIDTEHSGRDLGLRLIHELLVFLRDEWVIAVIQAAFWNTHLGLDNVPESERKTRAAAANLKLAKYFARMGFQQAGRNGDHCQAWYLTSLTYFGSNESPKSPLEALSDWKTKNQIQSLEVYVPPEKYEPSGVDKELADLVDASLEKNNIDARTRTVNIRRMQDLIENQSASIYWSRVLWVLSANCGKESLLDQEILRLLLRLGRERGEDINRCDEFGTHPLHVAASMQKLKIIELLLMFGADRNIKNEKGESPAQCLTADFNRTMGSIFSCLAYNRDYFNHYVKCITSLMDNQSKRLLVEGWLSPRMRYMLEITAGIERDSLTDDIISSFERYESMPLSRCCCIFTGIRRVDYIPSKVFSRNSGGIHKSFAEGWRIVWAAMLRILERNQAPTLSAIQREIDGGRYDIVKFEHFLNKGGKIEYAIDALFRITENVHVNGDDGWMYETFEDDINALPETTLDDAFSIGRTKCLENSTEVNEMCHGPYNHSIFLEDEED